MRHARASSGKAQVMVRCAIRTSSGTRMTSVSMVASRRPAGSTRQSQARSASPAGRRKDRVRFEVTASGTGPIAPITEGSATQAETSPKPSSSGRTPRGPGAPSQGRSASQPSSARAHTRRGLGEQKPPVAEPSAGEHSADKGERLAVEGGRLRPRDHATSASAASTASPSHATIRSSSASVTVNGGASVT